MSKKSILVIEDDSYLRNYLKDFFEKELEVEVEVETASSTNEALRALERGSFDLVFSDNQFPRFSDGRSQPEANQGIEIMEWMWLDDDYRNTPFILHTSEASDHVVQMMERYKRLLLVRPQPFTNILHAVNDTLKTATA